MEEKMNTKKQKKSRRDIHLKWIDYYSSKNFGIWIECTECKKWRKTLHYSEDHEVPKNWCCSELTLENGEKGNCNEPEEQHDEPYLDYSPGSIVWAKVDGYPWWPAMVDGDPDTDEFSWKAMNFVKYNVTFLDEKPTHAWVPDASICPFLKPPKEGKGSIQKFRQKSYAKAISKAKEQAEAAMKMKLQDRLQTYSFVHRYKGRWPEDYGFGECDNENNGSRNLEDESDLLLKNLAEIPSNTIANNDNERSKKEKNMTEESGIIPKKNPIQKKGIKRKTKEKLVPKKQKTSEKPTYSLTNHIADSVTTETFKEIFVLKKKGNKSFQDSEENFVAKRENNGEPKMIEIKKIKPKKKSNKVFNEKEFIKDRNISTEESIKLPHFFNY